MLSILIILLFLSLIAIVTLSNTLTCYFFYHDEWMLWEKVIKNFDTKVFNKRFTNDTVYNITINNITYDIHYWSDGSVSLFNGNDCILSSYDKYHQEKIKELFENEKRKNLCVNY